MNTLQQLAKKVKIIATDVDGVLSKQDVVYDADLHQVRIFSIKDGSACQAAMANGIIIAFVSGRHSDAVVARAKALGIDELYFGKVNKFYAVDNLCKKYSVTYDEVCFITDDFYDIPMLTKVGFPCAVADADEDVKRLCLYCTERKGGEGAVADVIRLILVAKYGADVFSKFANDLWIKNE